MTKNVMIDIVDVTTNQKQLIRVIEDIFEYYKVLRIPKELHILLSEAQNQIEPMPSGTVCIYYGIRNNPTEKLFEEMLGEEIRKKVNELYSYDDIQKLKENSQITDACGNLALENVLNNARY